MARSRSQLVVVFLLIAYGCGKNPSYQDQIRAEVPLYDKQNEQTMKSVPVPPNSEQTARSVQGVLDYSAYTRSLTVTYASPEAMENILAFYESELPKAGWLQLQKMDNSWVVYYDAHTACLQIVESAPTSTTSGPDSNLAKTVYNVTLWHDFFSQPFSPPTPDGENLCAEIFAGACHPCPPAPN